MQRFGLDPIQTKIITDILANYPEIESAVIYGSRAKGNFREGSDVDLTLKGKRLDNQILLQVMSDLDDSLSPYLFDLSIYHQLKNTNLIEEIDRTGQIFYLNEG
ncbi:hypothetical protein A1D22_06830 [Pasteurellaceae bacterium LFhippo2]|nr:hypothetical protein [Pasteurellaceae bacterium LFhippo2]